MAVSAIPLVNSVFFPLSISALIFEIRTDAGSWFASQCNTSVYNDGFFLFAVFRFFSTIIQRYIFTTEFVDHTKHFVTILNWTYSQMSYEKRRNRLTK